MRITTKDYGSLVPAPDPPPVPHPLVPEESITVFDDAADGMYEVLRRKEGGPAVYPWMGGTGMPTPGVGVQTNKGDTRRSPQLDEEARDAFMHRLWSEATPWVAAAVDTRCGDVMAAEWDILSSDASRQDDDEREALESLRFLFENPCPPSKKGADDGDDDADYPGLVGPVTRDAIVVGRGVMKPHYTEGGNVWRLDPVDANTVRRNPAWEPGSAKGKWLVRESGQLDVEKEIEVGASELIVLELSDTTYSQDGVAPMTALHRFLVAELDIFMAMHYQNKTLQASGVLNVPTPNTKTVNRIIAEWKQRVQGKGGVVIANLPDTTKFINMTGHTPQAAGSMDFYDLLLRGIGVVLRFPSNRMNWTRTLLDRQSEEQSAIYDEGKIALLRLWARAFNRRVVRPHYGAHNLRYVYRELGGMEEAEATDSINAKAGTSVQLFPVAKLWEAAGLGDLPYHGAEEALVRPYLHEPRWLIGNGIYLPLSIAARYLEQTYGRPNPQAVTPQADNQPGASHQSALPPPPPALPASSFPAAGGHPVTPRAYLSVVPKEADLAMDTGGALAPTEVGGVGTARARVHPETEALPHEIEGSLADALDRAFDLHLAASADPEPSRIRTKAGWDEERHPRGGHGHFASIGDPVPRHEYHATVVDLEHKVDDYWNKGRSDDERMPTTWSKKGKALYQAMVQAAAEHGIQVRETPVAGARAAALGTSNKDHSIYLNPSLRGDARAYVLAHELVHTIRGHPYEEFGPNHYRHEGEAQLAAHAFLVHHGIDPARAEAYSVPYLAGATEGKWDQYHPGSLTALDMLETWFAPPAVLQQKALGSGGAWDEAKHPRGEHGYFEHADSAEPARSARRGPTPAFQERMDRLTAHETVLEPYQHEVERAIEARRDAILERMNAGHGATFEPALLEGDSAGGRALRTAMTRAAAGAGVRHIHYAHIPFDEQANGGWIPKTREIYINPELGPDQQAKTLAHEVSHAYHDHKVASAAAEIEAEGTAHLLAHHYGLDSSAWSIPVLLGEGMHWQNSVHDAPNATRQRRGKIVSAAAALIDAAR